MSANFAVSQTNEQKSSASYFKNSYVEARQQFLESTKHLESSMFELKSYPSPQDPSLITDVLWIKQPTPSTRLQVYVSGVHGAEGYVGSALQSWLLAHPNLLNLKSDYVFIHAFNPYGFKKNRRVNENNVDLNRSFLQNLSEYQRPNLAYDRINTFINPTESVDSIYFGQLSFLFSALKLILENSIETLRKGILLGQYQYPKGIFFGGSCPPYQVAMLTEIKDRIFLNYKNIFVVDIHTGYGKKNELHLLANSKKGKSAALLNSIFKDRVDFGDKDKFYSASGDLISYLEKQSSPEHSVFGITFEFGTLDSQTTLGSIESLRRLVLENQKFHYGAKSVSVEKEINSLFSELFNPESPEFRSIIFPKAAAEIQNINDFFR